MKELLMPLYKLIKIIKALILWGLLIILLLSQNWVRCSLSLNGDKILQDINNAKKKLENVERK